MTYHDKQLQQIKDGMQQTELFHVVMEISVARDDLHQWFTRELDNEESMDETEGRL